jgi:sugar/nucleoside kinase (ribokinase family)
MPPESPLTALDLLVVGGLTIDRFADGSQAPGGAVIHIARAVAAQGMRVGVVAAAGPEPVTAAAVAELRSLAAALDVTATDATITYRHLESAAGRRLWLERRGGRVAVPRPEPGHLVARAVLFAPVAGEVAARDLGAWAAVGRRGATLQGWLRAAGEGEEVRPRRLAELSPEVVAGLAELDLVVGSREDLAAERADPPGLVAAVRDTLGSRPAIVVTDGGEGLWVDRTGGRRPPSHARPNMRLEGVPTVGAGDILAALLLVNLEDGTNPALGDGDWARPAMDLVERILADRRGAPPPAA